MVEMMHVWLVMDVVMIVRWVFSVFACASFFVALGTQLLAWWLVFCVVMCVLGVCEVIEWRVMNRKGGKNYESWITD